MVLSIEDILLCIQWPSVFCFKRQWKKLFESLRSTVSHFFLLMAAWVCPGRSALQSAEQWCQRRYGHKHQMMSFIIKILNKNMQKGHKSTTKPSATSSNPIVLTQEDKKRALVKSQRKAPTPEWESASNTLSEAEGFGEIPKESTYARAWRT